MAFLDTQTLQRLTNDIDKAVIKLYKDTPGLVSLEVPLAFYSVPSQQASKPLLGLLSALEVVPEV